jgi:hypothetical protein
MFKSCCDLQTGVGPSQDFPLTQILWSSLRGQWLNRQLKFPKRIVHGTWGAQEGNPAQLGGGQFRSTEAPVTGVPKSKGADEHSGRRRERPKRIWGPRKTVGHGP